MGPSQEEWKKWAPRSGDLRGCGRLQRLGPWERGERGEENRINEGRKPQEVGCYCWPLPEFKASLGYSRNKCGAEWGVRKGLAKAVGRVWGRMCKSSPGSSEQSSSQRCRLGFSQNHRATQDLEWVGSNGTFCRGEVAFLSSRSWPATGLEPALRPSAFETASFP